MPGFGSLAQTPDEPYPEEGAGMPETYQSPAGRALANIGIGLAKAIWDIPRRLGQAAEVPAGLRREDVTDIPVRHGITGTNQFGSEPQDELVEGTTGSAINRIGTGLPFAPRGVGAFGGKLAKPIEAVQSEAPHQSPYAGWHEAMEGIKAYHGSPHDFDRFDVSKIGTGEGAQAYGHGLYFAENEGVARAYREALAGTPGISYAGSQADRLSAALKDMQGIREANASGPMFDSIRKDIHTDIARNMVLGDVQGGKEISRLVEDIASRYPEEVRPQIAQWANEAVNHIEPKLSYERPGHMYEVNIKADPEHFLDWDKPLSQMSPQVQKKLNDAWLAHPEVHANQSGGEIYRNAGLNSWEKGESKPDIAAVRVLREAGIPGIKYLDQGSRNTLAKPSLVTNPDGTQQWATQSATGAVRRFSSKEAADKFWQSAEDRGRTHNYVVFDDKLIDILRKYGWAGLVGSAGLLGGKDPSKEM